MNSTYKTMKKTLILTIIMVFTFSVSVFAADVAKIGETAYATLNEALEAVQDGETITLVANAEGGFDVGNSSGTKPKKFTIDLAGNEIDLKEPVGSTNTVTNGIRVLANSELTIKNGTINASSEKVKVVIANYGKLTLNGVTVNSGVNTLYTINNRGNLTLEGATTVETSKSGDNISITNDPYDYIYTDVNASLNIESEEVKVGTILVERYARNTKNTGVPEINISAGTIENIKDDGNTEIEVIGNITGGEYSNSVDKIFLNKNNLVELKAGDTNNKNPYTYHATEDAAKAVANENDTIINLALPSELKTDIGEKAFKVGEPTEFTFTTIANGDKDIMVIGTSSFSDIEAIEKLEYYEVSNDTWYPLEGNYGSSTGFPMSNATSKFRVIFKTAGTYTFTASMMPVGGEEVLCSTEVEFTVSAKTSSSSGGGSGSSSEESKWENPYTDVEKEDWYYEAIEFVDSNELFNGVTTDAFAPKTNMTRGMLITVLYRHAKANVTEKSTFEDVKEDMYYSSPIAWAAEKGIINGIGDNKFAPDKEVTREQLVAILYRYAKFIEKDVSVGEDTNILSYDDIAEVSEYAIPAFKWACGEGIVTGRTESTLAPKGTATRAEVATMLMRFCEIA